MDHKKGLSLPVTIVIILVVSILVLLVMIGFLGWGWDPGPINETREGIEEQHEEEDPIDDIFNSTSQDYQKASESNSPATRAIESSTKTIGE